MILELLYILIIDLLALFGVYLIINISLNLEYGLTGLPNFGKVLAVAGGAFVAGSLPGRLMAEYFGLYRGINAYAENSILVECMRGLALQKPKILESAEFIEDNVLIVTCLNRLLANDPVLSVMILLLTVLVAAGVGAGLGFVSSYPAIRLREDYLAMTLLAMGEFMWTIGYYTRDLVGGTLGVSVVDPYGWAGVRERFLMATLVLVGTAFLAFVYMGMVARSPLGRLLRAVRDQELAAEALGKDTVKIKRNVLMVSAALAAVAGALWAFYSGGIIAVGYDRVTWTFWPWVMVIVGGSGNTLGVLLGTGLFVSARKFIDYYKFALEPYLPFSVVWLDRLLLGVVLLAILLIRPGGAIPEKPTLTLARDKIIRILNKLENSKEDLR
ncbi:MAG: branched-chain amino acid ABC transporter permease [Candidatus Caldarchaeum sp.]|nr:branched-chain amino acid ABC transporter permease [Candidatus Caldarchaeum sp.]